MAAANGSGSMNMQNTFEDWIPGDKKLQTFNPYEILPFYNAKHLIFHLSQLGFPTSCGLWGYLVWATELQK